MGFKLKVLTLCGLCVLGSAQAYGQVSITSASTMIDYVGFDGSGFAPMPAAGQLDSDDYRFNGFSDGDMTYGGTFDTGDYARGMSTGGVTSGGVYSFEFMDSSNNTITLLGVQPTGGDYTPGDSTLRVQNNTGSTITGFSITYGYWFNNNGDRSTSIIFRHSADDMTYTTGTIPLGTPQASDTNGWTGPANVTETVTGISVPDGGFYYFQVATDDDAGSGSRDELGVATIAINATIMAAPTCASDADCDDTMFCNGAETCDPMNAAADASGCVAGTPPVVDDGASCTADSCDEMNDMVVNAPDNTACDDGAYCNGSETCDPDDASADATTGCVAGTAIDVDDGFSCTTDSCDETNDMVVNTPDNTACDDGAYCNGVETCAPADMGADSTTGCIAGTAVVVDDGVTCTDDSCDEMNDVVVNTPNNALCDDSDTCTSDVCDATNDCQNTAVGCTIDNACHMDGAVNPANPCEGCNIATSTTAWTTLAQGTVCGTGMCTNDTLTPAPQCDAAGMCVQGADEMCVNGCGTDACNPPCMTDADCTDSWCDVAAGGVCSTENRPPIAMIDAIDDDVVVGADGGTFQVDGTSSSDPDGDTLTYEWEIVSGGALTFDDATSDNPTVTVPTGVEGTVEIGLTVNDGTVDSAQAVETLTVRIEAGEDMGMADMGSEDMGTSDTGTSDMGTADVGADQGQADQGQADVGTDAGPTKPVEDDGCCATANSRSPGWMLFLVVAIGLLRRRRR